ncbi:MAG: bifunctional precorrin-2 dehydrogenase/sirohydrochlorin ferrochelatase [Desulfuromonadaceae bacterium]|nr:bifunctional precorrin-2 dehydrogenase/sirohydrochlorin ferrochelatase [Desulfuromonadaceae bacterium]MDD2855086.1 bifunctional precorrin-2 dehydrogenase/sirohydrochlorin ferrochelatase [Desulfuromonadaceae bacterium]
MSTLALNIRMSGRLAVIIGGGVVALRKLKTLLAAGASVRVVAIDAAPEIVMLKNSGSLEIRSGSYTSDDLNGAFLAVAATSDPLLNAQVCEDAYRLGILVVSADRPESGSATFPALLRRGNLEIAVSTGGCCPTFAADVRNIIAESIGDEYALILQHLAEEREKLLTNGSTSTYNVEVLRLHAKRLLKELADPELKESMP